MNVAQKIRNNISNEVYTHTILHHNNTILLNFRIVPAIGEPVGRIMGRVRNQIIDNMIFFTLGASELW